MIVYIFCIRDKISNRKEVFSSTGKASVEKRLDFILKTLRNKEVSVDKYETDSQTIIEHKVYHTLDREQEIIYYCNECQKKIYHGDDIYEVPNFELDQIERNKFNYFCSDKCALNYCRSAISHLDKTCRDYEYVNWIIQDISDDESEY